MISIFTADFVVVDYFVSDFSICTYQFGKKCEKIRKNQMSDIFQENATHFATEKQQYKT